MRKLTAGSALAVLCGALACVGNAGAATLLSDSFPAGALNPQWSATVAGSGAVAIGAHGGLDLSAAGVPSAASSGDSAFITSRVPSVVTGAWTLSSGLSAANFSSAAPSPWLIASFGGTVQSFALSMEFASAQGFVARFWDRMGLVAEATIPAASAWRFVLASDGRTVSAFVNGEPVGSAAASGLGSLLSVRLRLDSDGASPTTASFASVLLTDQFQPPPPPPPVAQPAAPQSAPVAAVAITPAPAPTPAATVAAPAPPSVAAAPSPRHRARHHRRHHRRHHGRSRAVRSGRVPRR